MKKDAANYKKIILKQNRKSLSMFLEKTKNLKQNRKIKQV